MTDTGRSAQSPWHMPWAGWKAVLKRTWSESGDDNIGIVAAGVAFYGFLAIVPLLAATVLSYGLLANPKTVADNIRTLASAMPADAAGLIGDQLKNVVATSDGKKGWGLLLAIAFALFGARNGAGSIITALNIAYEEEETRSFIRLNLLAIGITVVAVVVALLSTVAITVLGQLKAMLPSASGVFVVLSSLASYAVLGMAAAAAAATLFRYGPARAKARWTWISPGSLLAAGGGVVLTIGFGIYVSRFSSYNATYGSLSAVVVLLTWMYLSAYLLLLGAELNSELEHQTAQDTTGGAAQPLGERGAWVADHVAESGDGDPTPGAGPRAAPAPPLVGQEFAVVRSVARAGAVAGLPRLGLLPQMLATGGLALLRRPGRRMLGAGLLLGAAAAAWRSREVPRNTRR